MVHCIKTIFPPSPQAMLRKTKKFIVNIAYGAGGEGVNMTFPHWCTINFVQDCLKMKKKSQGICYYKPPNFLKIHCKQTKLLHTINTYM